MAEGSYTSFGLPPVHCDANAVPTLSRGSPCSDRRHAAKICLLSMLTATLGAILVTNIADVTASLKGNTDEERRLEEVFFPQSHDELYAHDRRLQTRCTFDLGWVNAQWDSSLTKEERDALMQLGWTKEEWDNSYGAAKLGVTTTTTTTTQTTLFGQTTTLGPTLYGTPSSERKCWQELNAIEQDAAKFLQYTITRWMDCKKPGCSWPPGVPTPSATCLTKLKYMHSIYNFSRPWLKLTKRKRDNMVLLGWDPDGVAWMQGRTPNTYGRPWSELTPREIQSARFLGYTSEIWSGCNAVITSSCLDRLEYIETTQRGWIWEQLKPGYTERLTDLGWTMKTWFDGEEPAVIKAAWTGIGSITSQQRSSARILGWTQDTWSKCPAAGCVERFDYIKRRWHGIKWMQMKLSERRAWLLLGSTEALWNSGNSPSTGQLQWKELTPEQQVQAEFLGYNEGTWQGCNLEWGANDTAAGGANGTIVDPNGPVRARMAIDRPYSEISGNVYGNAVANMPVSFIRVFESAVARALFCGNPPLSLQASTYIGPDGEPLCITATNFEMQRKRIRVLTVVEGDVSAVNVDFYIVRNNTPSQPTSRVLYEVLVRQLDAKFTSPLCHDKYFGRFAVAATMTETSMALFTDIAKPLIFEQMRNMYGPSNYCVLKTDAKKGQTTCANYAGGRHSSLFSRTFAGFFLSLIVLNFSH